MKCSHPIWLGLMLSVTVAVPLTLAAPQTATLGTNLPTAGCDDDDDDDGIEDRMEKVHKGRRAPFKQLEQALEANQPDWEAIARSLPPLTKMAQLLQESKNQTIRDSSDGYADAVKSLLMQAQTHNLPAARKAYTALSESCGDCHYKGGVGGKLDD